ncbi:hypothetical protein VNO77_19803 [Canavalia gladiata]|uniref:Uncharacterized protein n=1 Tax=Canavalia gladiata TaxID=3824 RepID=A0AAN9QKU6_CANGL
MGRLSYLQEFYNEDTYQHVHVHGMDVTLSRLISEPLNPLWPSDRFRYHPKPCKGRLSYAGTPLTRASKLVVDADDSKNPKPPHPPCGSSFCF